ncbi:hypothetical protein [Bacillus cereus]|uniref:hypothetical protein n=1 Tax=Bacillus cereus TaxID=1396 RepID=UPI0018D042AB|nr:hypothetical protein [Bacillus cereus]MBH0323612.1 hypothetical protein [Bacillus cereus]
MKTFLSSIINPPKKGGLIILEVAKFGNFENNQLHLKSFSLCNGQVVFFEKSIQKISTFPPLHKEIRLILSFRQAEQTKNEVKLLDLD